MSFASLHNHSHFSLLDAVMSPSDVVQQAYDLGFSAVSLTEHANIFSFIEGYKKAKELGIKYIPGVEAYETSDMEYKEKDADRYHLILLAKSNVGLKNLFKIVTESYTRGFYGKPRVSLDFLKDYAEDVICMSACLGGKINRMMGCSYEVQRDDLEFGNAILLVQQYKKVFGDNFYLEMQSHDTEAQSIANRNLVRLAHETDTKLTITFDTHLRDGSEIQRNTHAIFIQTSQDRDENDFTSIVDTYEGCWAQSIEEIHDTMDEQIGADIVNEAIQNTCEIGEMCEVEIPLHQNLMPHVDLPDGFETEQQYLKHLVNVGWKKRGINKLDKDTRKIYIARLQHEFEIIDYLDYCGYFIFMQTLVNEFRNRKIPMNYGRGSAAGCLMLYLLGVTDVDSVKWDLDFSRFANKGRVGSPPDVDLDISQERRQEALQIVSELFGAENVCQVATFNSMSPKVAIRDIGKALDSKGIYSISYDVRDKISKLIPDDPNEKMTIQRAMELNSELKKYQKLYPLLFEYAMNLQNIPKSVGCHASAVLITPMPVLDYFPLMNNKDGNVMSQLDMHDSMDEIGATKLDLLGLKTLDVVDKTLRSTGLDWDDIDINKINTDDSAVLDGIYGEGKTFGIFQMESVVAQKIFQELKPNIKIQDVFAVNSLNRPAVLSIGMHNVYTHCKKHPEDAKYIHEDLKDIFGSTNSICLYQEQALKVFRYAGFPEDQVDDARRSIGKKKADVMLKLFVDFEIGLKSKGWTEDQINGLWEIIVAQSGYSFNASHCVSYGLLSYVTAYLKYHHPTEFMTALLISKIGDYGQITKCVNECNELGVKVLPPDINKSDSIFTIHDGSILFGLQAINGIGEVDVNTILNARKDGMFDSFDDFIKRCKLNTGSMVSLIKSGAFGQNKTELLREYSNTLFEWKEYKPVIGIPSKVKLYESGIIQSDEEFKDKDNCLKQYNDMKRIDFNDKQQDKFDTHVEQFHEKYMSDPELYEFETLSIFLIKNPFERYKDIFTPSEEKIEGDSVVLGGVVSNIQFKRQKNGAKMAYVDIFTPNGIVECIVFSTLYNQFQDVLKKLSKIVILARKSGSQYIMENAKLFDDWKVEYQQRQEQQKEGVK